MEQTFCDEFGQCWLVGCRVGVKAGVLNICRTASLHAHSVTSCNLPSPRFVNAICGFIEILTQLEMLARGWISSLAGG
jgi:hypothetical protein